MDSSRTSNTRAATSREATRRATRPSRWPPGAQRKQLESTLKQARSTGIKVQQAEEKAKQAEGGRSGAPGTNPLQNPFGGTPTTPAPTTP